MASIIFAKHFHDEQAAHDYVEARLWPEGATCPRCGERKLIDAGKLNPTEAEEALERVLKKGARSRSPHRDAD